MITKDSIRPQTVLNYNIQSSYFIFNFTQGGVQAMRLKYMGF